MDGKRVISHVKAGPSPSAIVAALRLEGSDVSTGWTEHWQDHERELVDDSEWGDHVIRWSDEAYGEDWSDTDDYVGWPDADSRRQ